MSLHQLAQHMAAQGRGPDNMLVHMAPDEVAKLQSIARARGGSLTINPQTGLVEAGLLSDFTGAVSDVWSGAKDLVSDVTSSPLGSLLTGGALAAMGVPPNLIPYIVGGAATIATGDLGKGLMAGLGAYGGSEAAAGMNLGAAGSSTVAPTLAPVSDAGTALQGAGAGGSAATGTGLSTLPSSVTPAQAAFNPVAADQAVAAAMPQTTTAMPPVSMGDKVANWAATNPGKAALAAGTVGAMAGSSASTPKGVNAPELPPGYIRPFVYDPQTHGLRQLAPVKAPGYADGGTTSQAAAEFLQGLRPSSTGVSSKDASDYLAGKNQPVAVAPPAGAPSVAKPVAATPTQPQIYIPKLDTKALTAKPAATDPAVPGYYVRDASGNMAYKKSVIPTATKAAATEVAPPPSNISAVNNFTDTDLVAPSVATKAATATKVAPPPNISAVNNFTDTDLVAPSFITRSYVDTEGGANGGLMGEGYAAGGLGSLGGFSDGGRLLKGPGDGVSDSIPATIGRGQQPARLADGEFVIPARIVSELGNGSTDAGARQLYKMMDRIQAARSKTTGKNKVAANTRAAKHLPA